MDLKEITELIKVIQEPQKKKDEIIYEYIQYIRNNSMINVSQSENKHNNIINSTYVEDNNVHENNHYFHEQTSDTDEPSIQEVQINKPIIKIEDETIENVNNDNLNKHFLKINNQINNIIKKIENPLYIINTKSKYMKKKDFLFKIQNGKCLYCNKNKKMKYLTKEHLIPKSFNGNSNIGNICLVCNDCNAKRGNDMTDNNFIQEILNRIDQIWFYDTIKDDIQNINIEINNLKNIINS